MNVSEGPLNGLLIIEPKVLRDIRGYFFESYQKNRYADYGLPAFVQDNYSHSKKNVVRGLHYQLPHAQGKLVGVVNGTVWDVVVDLRQSSKTFRNWFGLTLSADNHTQLYIPPGFAHGFCVLSESADFYYKCTDFYSPQAELGIAWDDKELNIDWPTKTPILSDKDKTYPVLKDVPHEHLFA